MSVSGVNQNNSAMMAYQNLISTQVKLAKNANALSSGIKISSARDDATGLTISERFRAQISGYEGATNNANDANNLLQTADGALSESSSIINRLRELALSAANGATADEDRVSMQKEASQLLDELNNISGTTQYNGRNLLDGSMSGTSQHVNASAEITRNEQVNQESSKSGEAMVSGVDVNSANNKDVTFEIKLVSGTADGSVNAEIYASDQKDGKPVATISNLQSGQKSADLSSYGYSATIDLNQVSTEDIGKSSQVRIKPEEDAVISDNSASFQIGANEGQGISIGLGNMSSSGLRLNGLDLTSQLGARNAISRLDDAAEKLSTQRVNIGSTQKRLDSVISSNRTSMLNQIASESSIRDADIALEMMDYTKNDMLSKSGTALLALSNASQQSVLALLGSK